MQIKNLSFLMKVVMCGLIIEVVFAADESVMSVFSERTLGAKKFCAITEAARVVDQLNMNPSLVIPQDFDRNTLMHWRHGRRHFDYQAYTDLVSHYFIKLIGDSVEGVREEKQIKKNLKGLLKNFFEQNVLHENDIVKIAETYGIPLTYRFHSRLRCKESRKELVYAGVMQSVQIKK